MRRAARCRIPALHHLPSPTPPSPCPSPPQAIGLLDDLDKELNTYAMRVREWYGWHFPEMTKIVTDNIAYAKTGARRRSRRCCRWRACSACCRWRHMPPPPFGAAAAAPAAADAAPSSPTPLPCLLSSAAVQSS